MQRLPSQKVSTLVNPAPLKHILGLGVAFVPIMQEGMKLTGSTLVEGAFPQEQHLGEQMYILNNTQGQQEKQKGWGLLQPRSWESRLLRVVCLKTAFP